MRYAFFLIIIVLLELFSFGAVLSLQWWFQPLTATIPMLKTVIFAVIFLMSNGLLLLSTSKIFANGYRWVSGWMLVMHFIMLTALLTSILYGSYLFINLSFGSLINNVDINGLELRVLALFIFIAMFIYASYSAYCPVVRRLDISINKSMQGQLRIAVASDMHFGRLFGSGAIDRLRRFVVQEQADVLLMPGDIMDDNTRAFNAYNMKKNLAELCHSLPYGVYATLGNHDLYGHEQSISQALRSAGVQLLTDEVICLDYQGQPIWLIGRFDNHKSQRVATTELLSQVNVDEPVIVLDHRPSDIVSHSQLPIDLQVSGHTHNGQIFPANVIVKAINRLGYGYEAIGHGHFVVSSGYGFWGIPFRLGSRSEIWLIKVSGKLS